MGLWGEREMGTQLGAGYDDKIVAPPKRPALPAYINAYSLSLTSQFGPEQYVFGTHLGE